MAAVVSEAPAFNANENNKEPVDAVKSVDGDTKLDAEQTGTEQQEQLQQQQGSPKLQWVFNFLKKKGPKLTPANKAEAAANQAAAAAAEAAASYQKALAASEAAKKYADEALRLEQEIAARKEKQDAEKKRLEEQQQQPQQEQQPQDEQPPKETKKETDS